MKLSKQLSEIVEYLNDTNVQVPVEIYEVINKVQGYEYLVKQLKKAEITGKGLC